MGAAFREVTLLPASPWLLCSLGGAPSPPLPVPPCLGTHCLCPPPFCLQPANRRCLTQKWSCEGPCPPLRSLAGCCRWSQHGNPTSCVALRGGAPGAPAAEHRHHRTEKLRRLRRPGGHGRRELGSALRTASGEGGQTLAEAGTEVGGWGRGLSGWPASVGHSPHTPRSARTGSATHTPLAARHLLHFLSCVFAAGACVVVAESHVRSLAWPQHLAAGATRPQSQARGLGGAGGAGP